MNARTHVSAAAQGPDQGGLVELNENMVPSNQVHGVAGSAGLGADRGRGAGAGLGGGAFAQLHSMHSDVEMLRMRSIMRDRILMVLLRYQIDPVDEPQRMKFIAISERLEEGLFRTAHSKEDYVNVHTLEVRLSNLIRSQRENIRNQQRQDN